jgi:hypothetical protein
MLAQARIPLYLAARALNRQPIEAILGLALRNSKGTDAKSQYPVLAFSGAKLTANAPASAKFGLMSIIA